MPLMAHFVKSLFEEVLGENPGDPTYFLIPYEEMIEVVEVLEELSDLQTVQRIAEGRKAYARGGWTPTASLWKKLSSPRS